MSATAIHNGLSQVKMTPNGRTHWVLTAINAAEGVQSSAHVRVLAEPGSNGYSAVLELFTDVLRTGEDPGLGDRTFVTLDALRGIAAIAVVTFHFHEYFFQYTNHGYLAVHFFYMLSGFVLSYAYQQRLDAGWKCAAFLKTRLIRLYPMFRRSGRWCRSTA